MRTLLANSLLAAAVFFSASSVYGHPIPDIPVRSQFEPDRTCRITVEIDVRCFSEDALNEPYLLNWILDEMNEVEKNDLRKKAATLVREAVAFRFEPSGPIQPDFAFSFTGKEGALLAEAGDPVMLTGTWTTATPPNVTGYQVEALAGGRFDLQFLNWIAGRPVERRQVLFPNEKSFVLDLSGIHASVAPPAATKAAVSSGDFKRYLPFAVITLLLAVAIIGLAWARRNRGG